MDQTLTGAIPAKPLWRRIVDFPLVAMLIILVALFATLTIFTLLLKMLPPDHSIVGKAWHTAIAMTLLIAAFKFTNSRLGDIRRDDLSRVRAFRNLGIGIVAGVMIHSAVIGEASLLHVYRVVGLGDTRQLWIALIDTAIVPGITEEVLFRGVLQRWLEEFGGTAFGLVASALLFGLAHAFNPGVTPFAILVIVVAGIWLGTAYKLSGSLWFPIGLHAAWNFAQGEIWDVPVSGFQSHGLLDARLTGPTLLTGGPFGLEASILALVVMVLVSAWQAVVVYRRGLTMPNWWVRRRLARSEETVGVDVDRDADLGSPVERA